MGREPTIQQRRPAASARGTGAAQAPHQNASGTSHSASCGNTVAGSPARILSEIVGTVSLTP